MFSLTIVFGPSATAWRLLFKARETADKAMTSLNIPPTTPATKLEFLDDFGQHAVIAAAGIHGYMLENMDESKVGMVEFSLHNERTKASYQQRIENDPTLRAAAASSQRGPGIISPMGNGRFS